MDFTLVRPLRVLIAQVRAQVHCFRTHSLIVTYTEDRYFKYLKIPLLTRYVLIETEDGTVFYQSSAEEAEAYRSEFRSDINLIRSTTNLR